MVEWRLSVREVLLHFIWHALMLQWAVIISTPHLLVRNHFNTTVPAVGLWLYHTPAMWRRFVSCDFLSFPSSCTFFAQPTSQIYNAENCTFLEHQLDLFRNLCYVSITLETKSVGHFRFPSLPQNVLSWLFFGIRETNVCNSLLNYNYYIVEPMSVRD